MIDWWCSEGTTLDSVLPPYVLGASLGESRFGAVAVRIVYVLRRQEHVHRPLAHVQLRNRRRLLLLPLLLLPLLIFVLLLPAALLLLLLDLGASRVLLAVGVVLVVVDDLVVVLDAPQRFLRVESVRRDAFHFATHAPQQRARVSATNSFGTVSVAFPVSIADVLTITILTSHVPKFRKTAWVLN